MIKVIDNVLTPTYANTLEHDVYNVIQYCYTRETSENNGFYTGPIYKDEYTHDTGQFSCPVLVEEHNQLPFSWYFNIVKPLIYTITDLCPELEIEGLVRMKINLLLQNKLVPEFHYNIPHQDAVDNCYSVVYYCNDSDGDTFLFNEFYEQGKTPDRLTIDQRVTPRKNRIVIFESHRYHASSNPIENKERFVMNFVFKARMK